MKRKSKNKKHLRGSLTQTVCNWKQYQTEASQLKPPGPVQSQSPVSLNPLRLPNRPPAGCSRVAVIADGGGGTYG